MDKKMTIKKKHWWLFCAGYLLAFFPLYGQNINEGKLSIEKIRVKEGFIEMDIIACNGYGQALFPDYSKEGIKVGMSVGNKIFDSLEVYSLVPIANEDSSTTVATQMKVHFLLDISGSMKGEKLLNAKKAIRELFYAPSLQNTQKEFSWFHDDIGPTRSLRKDNVNNIVDRVEVQKDTDLHGALLEKINELHNFNGTKILILLTDGIHDIRKNPYYLNGNKIPISEEQILNQIGILDSSFQIYPIGIGNDASESFLQAIANQTLSTNDGYSFGVAPNEIAIEFRKILDCLHPNYRLKCLPSNKGALGVEKRRFNINYTSSNKEVYVTNLEAILGSPAHFTTVQKINIWSIFYKGLILIGFLLGLFSLIVPLYNSFIFKRKYVKRYGDIKQPNIRGIDPMSNEAFNDDDEVVIKGDKMMLHNTWKYCVNNPEIGADHGDFSELFMFANNGTFFSQKGPYLLLNWFWYGAVGGLLAWVVNFGLESISITAINNLFAQLDTEGQQISSAVYAETLVGAALGFSIILLLAIVEEIGQSRQFNLLRVLGRSMIGLVFGILVFFLEGILITMFIPDRFIGGFIGWVVFGTFLGFVLTLFSSIELWNGIKGGLIAGFTGFLIYYILNLPMLAEWANPEFIRMLSYMLYGATLGSIIKTVVLKLEDFELLILAPKPFEGRIIPISKWLKSSSIEYIYLGKDPGSHIYLKWDDPVAKRRHAKFSYDGKSVIVEPIDGDVLVSDQAIKTSQSLKNNDLISLGNNSLTLMQFRSRNPDDNRKGKTFIQSTQNSKLIRSKQRSTQEVKAIRGRISVKKGIN